MYSGFVCGWGKDVREWRGLVSASAGQLCVYCWAHCLLERIGYHCSHGWLAPYNNVKYIQQAGMDLVHFVRSATSSPLSHTFVAPSPPLSLPCPSFLYFALLSSYIIISLSLPLSLPPSPALLHNVQLYFLQLRILIFPTRQSARANQEKREEELGLTFLTCPCALPR